MLCWHHHHSLLTTYEKFALVAILISVHLISLFICASQVFIFTNVSLILIITIVIPLHIFYISPFSNFSGKSWKIRNVKIDSNIAWSFSVMLPVNWEFYFQNSQTPASCSLRLLFQDTFVYFDFEQRQTSTLPDIIAKTTTNLFKISTKTDPDQPQHLNTYLGLSLCIHF